jgi:hypothetical protein
MYGSTIRRLVLVAAVVAAGVGRVAAPPSVSPRDGEGFTACVRSHGLPGFPEVAVSSDGLINLDIKGERVDVLSGKYGAAVKACEPRLPGRAPGPPGAPAAPSAPSLPF